MQKLLFFLSLLSFIPLSLAQQIGTGAAPLSEQRLGLELGGYTSRGAGTGALVRYLHSVSEQTAWELAAGGATGTYGSRALLGIRQSLIREGVNNPSMLLRAGAESYRDQEGIRRNAFGGGLLLAQGFSVIGQEAFAFLQPRAQIGIEAATDEFDVVTGSSLGVNSAFKSSGRAWVGSVELDLGFQNAPSSFMVGLATDI